MILYDQSIPASLQEFGIQIPVRDSRLTKTFQTLLSDPELKSRQGEWWVPGIVEQLSREDLLRVHSREYVGRLYSPELEQEIIATYELVDEQGRYHRYDPGSATAPLTDLFERLLLKVAGTVQASRLALQNGFCFSFTGGAHHAQLDFGNGFCLLNDIVIACRKLQAEKVIQRAWVIDVDAHKGDGTAALTENDNSIRTLSIHMAKGWPLDGPATLADGRINPSFIRSDIEIPVESGEEGLYLDRLRMGLETLEESGRPELAIVVCGADPYEHDELPSAELLKLSLEQMFERDQLIYEWLVERGIPAAFLMAGGYGEEVWRVYAQFLSWVLRKRYVLTA